MGNFEERKVADISEPRYEVSIELEILQKKIIMMTESLGRLEKRIKPILRQSPKVEAIKNKTDAPPLVELAMKIQESNRYLEECNSRIIYMIDSCEL